MTRRVIVRALSLRFRGLLAGATLRDRTSGALGAAVAIALTGVFASALSGNVALFGPIGASAVLVFAVPASPLAQPWPVIGGNVLSALIGIAVAHLVADVRLASGLAVGLAIMAMSLCRCLHPPGGAAALTAVIGGPAIAAQGFGFAFWPIGVEAVALTIVGIAFHRLSGHAYPHHAVATILARPDARFVAEDIDAALAETGETYDISRDDMVDLFRRAGRHAERRSAVRG